MLRLPTYDEITSMPKDPPAYDILYTSTNLPSTLVVSHLQPEGATSSSQHTVEVNEVDERYDYFILFIFLTLHIPPFLPNYTKFLGAF